MKLSICLKVLIMSLNLSACDRHEPGKHHEPAPSAATGSIKLPGQASLGDTTTCTVHREHQIVVTAATPKVEYGGKTYYFCCPVCANKFAERPTDYLK